MSAIDQYLNDHPETRQRMRRQSPLDVLLAKDNDAVIELAELDPTVRASLFDQVKRESSHVTGDLYNCTAWAWRILGRMSDGSLKTMCAEPGKIVRCVAQQEISRRAKRQPQADERPPAPNVTDPNSASSAEPPNGADLLDEVLAFCKQFIAYPDTDSSIAHTLWIAHAWLVDLLFTTPRLAFVSPEKRSGKTRAQEVTAQLVPNPVNVVSVSPAYLYRRIQEKPDGMLPVIELDETDALFTGRPSETTEQIRGIINAGYRQGATVGRAEATKNGEVKTVDFPVFAAVCLAGIGNMPDTIADRAIIIHMKRRRPDYTLTPYRDRTVRRQAKPLRTRLAAWAQAQRGALAAYTDDDYPQMPDEIQDRDADVWEPLFIIAQIAGGHWPQLVSDTAIRIIHKQHEEPQSIGERLLKDIRTVFDDHTAIYRSDLIEQLKRIEGAPWRTLGKSGDGIDSWYLTKTLKQYDIAKDYGGRAHSIRIGGMPHDWGYYKSDFQDAWTRYLPAEDTPSANSVTPVTPETPDIAPADPARVTPVTTVTHFSEGVHHVPQGAKASCNEPEELDF
ncbi:MAG: DUF3631 domain-containing protein [Bifidobacterium psychraerophilum]|uniref:DUF3631 domain-containing protein n=1 Tax=Bifidobacterium psychraerophilum TaxID=218140 RepID=UPI0039E95EE0